jgi:anaerobic magnesium-protoporphyrin IX monomethyl ester cyclase
LPAGEVVNVAFVNLPYREPVMRRYVASYYAPNFLMPPMELMGLAAIVKEWKRGRVLLVDAMAEGLGLPALVKRLKDFAPDLVVTMTGFYIFGADLEALGAVKSALPPATRFACFGYLPSQFPDEVVRSGPADIVLMDEPELAFSEVYDRLAAGQPLDGVPGVAFRDGTRVTVNPRRPRVADLDALPFPDHSLINPDLYNESFLGRRIATVMTSRGCPFGCTYCVRTFGRRLVLRSAGNVLDEVERLVRVNGIRNIRFMDDTLAVDRGRAAAIFEGLIERGLDLNWTCLTRVDTLDEPLLRLMRRSGCRRMYVGVESGSPRILERLRKGLTVEQIERQIAMVRRAGMEVSAFFIVGAPGETEADLGRSIALARRLDIDYIIVTQIQAWPGTELWREWQARVRLSLFPFRIEWDEPRDLAAWERRFYREFYLRPEYVLRRLREFGAAKRDLALGLWRLLAYLLRREETHDFI